MFTTYITNPSNRKQGALDSFDRSPLWQLIHVVESLLRQFDQRSLAWFNQTVSKIGHMLKTVFYNLKSQGPLTLSLTAYFVPWHLTACVAEKTYSRGRLSGKNWDFDVVSAALSGLRRDSVTQNSPPPCCTQRSMWTLYTTLFTSLLSRQSFQSKEECLI